jgi:drug/metabolite transporter (DMT)-like permease
VFVAILKQFVLKDVLKRYMWVGIALNVLSIVMVGFTAMMIDAASAPAAAAAAVAAGEAPAAEGSAMLGVALILMGAFVQSLQYVFEEKVMSASEDDPNVAPTPPLLLVSVYCGVMRCDGT